MVSGNTHPSIYLSEYVSPERTHEKRESEGPLSMPFMSSWGKRRVLTSRTASELNKIEIWVDDFSVFIALDSTREENYARLASAWSLPGPRVDITVGRSALSLVLRLCLSRSLSCLREVWAAHNFWDFSGVFLGLTGSSPGRVKFVEDGARKKNEFPFPRWSQRHNAHPGPRNRATDTPAFRSLSRWISGTRAAPPDPDTNAAGRRGRAAIYTEGNPHSPRDNRGNREGCLTFLPTFAQQQLPPLRMPPRITAPPPQNPLPDFSSPTATLGARQTFSLTLVVVRVASLSRRRPSRSRSLGSGSLPIGCSASHLSRWVASNVSAPSSRLSSGSCRMFFQKTTVVTIPFMLLSNALPVPFLFLKIFRARRERVCDRAYVCVFSILVVRPNVGIGLVNHLSMISHWFLCMFHMYENETVGFFSSSNWPVSLNMRGRLVKHVQR